MGSSVFQILVGKAQESVWGQASSKFLWGRHLNGVGCINGDLIVRFIPVGEA
jgi:hypothetical protein